MSPDRLTEITARTQDGKPAPDFDTFIWGWGGDTYDPSTLLNLLRTEAIGASSDAFYSNPEYDRLYDEQLREFDPARRAAIVARMIDILQRDLPYLVLTVDPVLEAYRSDRIENVELSCPQPTGDVLCAATSYAPLLTLAPAGSGSGAGGDDDGGSGAGAAIAIAVVGAGRRRGPAAGDAGAAVARPTSRWRSSRDERALAGAEAGDGGADARRRARLQLLPLPHHGRPAHPARAAAARDAGGDRAAAGLLRARPAAAGPVRRLREGHADARHGRQPGHARVGLERDRDGAAVDAAAGRHRHADRDAARQLARRDRGDAARQTGRRRPALLQPLHLRGARVLDRDPADPAVRGRAADPPGRPADDARRRASAARWRRRPTSPST